jgi:hypothetical protein
MKSFRMRFVVSARRFDANGLLFSRDITSLSTPEEIAHALEGDFAEVQGGYVLLFDRRIWNSPQHALFDAEHVLCEMDSIAYAALMLEDCATHFEDPDMQSVAFAEMISLRVEEIGNDQLTVTGLNYRGDLWHPTEVVSSQRFVREVLRATTDFLRVAEVELERRMSLPPSDRQLHNEAANRTLLDRFRRAAERLRQARPEL